MHWKIIDKTYAIKNKWISVRKDHVLLPSGEEIDDFYVIERPNLVHVVAVDKNGLFIIEKQYRYAINKECYEICAGMIEPNESPLDAAKRELLEETGYSGGSWTIIGQHSVDPSNMTEMSYSFLATDVVKVSDQQLEETEKIEILLMKPDEVFRLLQNGDIISSLMAAPLWNYFYSILKDNFLI